MSDEWTISMREICQANVTDISFGTKAKYVYDLYLAKRKMLDDIKFECGLLVDKYFSEIKSGHIPLEFKEQFLKDLFSEDKKKAKFTKNLFLKRGFSADFIKNHKIDFVDYEVHGYSQTAIGVVIGIGDYNYTIQFPCPNNIIKDDDKKMLMGDVKFRVDRLHKSKVNEFMKNLESVCMPTYDWKRCFEAIEKVVEENK